MAQVLLSASMGSMFYEAIYVDDTVLWDPVKGISETFSGAQVAFHKPGETITLFPVKVDASSTVRGCRTGRARRISGPDHGASSATRTGDRGRHHDRRSWCRRPGA
jgi:hypothetical protein